jgi:hypothetical protein
MQQSIKLVLYPHMAGGNTKATGKKKQTKSSRKAMARLLAGTGGDGAGVEPRARSKTLQFQEEEGDAESGLAEADGRGGGGGAEETAASAAAAGGAAEAAAADPAELPNPDIVSITDPADSRVDDFRLNASTHSITRADADLREKVRECESAALRPSARLWKPLLSQRPPTHTHTHPHTPTPTHTHTHPPPPRAPCPPALPAVVVVPRRPPSLAPCRRLAPCRGSCWASAGSCSSGA